MILILYSIPQTEVPEFRLIYSNICSVCSFMIVRMFDLRKHFLCFFQSF